MTSTDNYQSLLNLSNYDLHAADITVSGLATDKLLYLNSSSQLADAAVSGGLSFSSGTLSMDPLSTPTFAGLTLTGFNGLLRATAGVVSGSTINTTDVAGTTNQVISTAGGSGVTLSLPQSIATNSYVQFGKLGVGVANTNFAALFAGGNVGIGTTNPYALLHLESAEYGTPLTAASYRLITNGSATFRYMSGIGQNDADSMFLNAKTTIRNYLSNVEILTITSGTTSITNNVDITGTTTVHGGLYGYGSIYSYSDISVSANTGFFGLNGSSAGSYSIQMLTAGGTYPMRFAGSSSAAPERSFDFGNYTSDNSANTWNSRFKINSYSGNLTTTGSATFGGDIYTPGSCYIGGTYAAAGASNTAAAYTCYGGYSGDASSLNNYCLLMRNTGTPSTSTGIGLGYGSAGSEILWHNAYASHEWYIQNSSKMVLNNTGLGIKRTPVALLHSQATVGDNSDFANYSLLCYNTGGATSSYGLGVESGHLWSSANTGFKWYNSGGERMRLTSTGLGIGGAANYLLNVYSPTTTSLWQAQFLSEAAVSGMSQTLIRIEKGSTYGGYIGGFISQGIGSGLTFGTLNGGSEVERMRISSNGFTGIGTDKASNLLSLANSGYLAWRNYANNAETVGIKSATSDNLEFYVNGTRMTILSTGCVGIGITDPTNILETKGTIVAWTASGKSGDYGNYYAKIQANYSSTCLQLFGYAGNEYFGVRNWTDTVMGLAGNVGIGTTPAAKLHVHGAASYTDRNTNPMGGQLILSSTGGGRTYIGEYFTGGVGQGSAIQNSDFYSGADHYGNLELNPNGGYVGVNSGTSYAQRTLDVNGTIACSILTGRATSQTAYDSLYFGGSASENFFLDRPGTGGAFILGYNTARASAGNTIFQIYNNSTDRKNLFYVNSAGSSSGKNQVNVNCSMVVGAGAVMATTVTDGFLYIPIVNGTPTGVPTTQTGSIAMCFDYTSNRICIYNGAWRYATVA